MLNELNVIIKVLLLLLLNYYVFCYYVYYFKTNKPYNIKKSVFKEFINFKKNKKTLSISFHISFSIYL
jgi:hypothetical protein